MKRVLKIMLITIILAVLAVPWVSCSPKSAAETIPESQVVTVQRGDLTVDITAAGNLTYSSTAEPAFKVAGYVEEVLVEAGDTVEKGQVLASLDTTTLDRAVKTAGQAVKTAEIDLETTTDNWRKITYPYTYTVLTLDVPAAVALTSDAQRELDEASEVMHELGMSREQYDWQQYWEVWQNLQDAQANLLKVKANLARGYGSDVFGQGRSQTTRGGVNYEVGILPMSDYWTLKAAQLNMEKAQLALDKANDALDIAKDELEKAVVVAPFAGFITKVNVEGGDEVFKGTVVAEVADPNKFEAKVMVSEMDIFQVKLGGNATVSVDAMPMLTLPAKVTHISPTATISAGVVNYQVKVELQSLEPIASAKQQSQVPAVLPENFQLREGLTVTVSIIVQQKTNVLLVPNAAITIQGGQSYVQVVSPTGAIERRAIKTGITDYTNTEVTEGLSEGEKVIVPQGTATTTPTQQQRGPMPFFGPPPR